MDYIKKEDSWKSNADKTNESLINIADSIVTINNTISLILNELADRNSKAYRQVSVCEGSCQTTNCNTSTVATQTDTLFEMET